MFFNSTKELNRLRREINKLLRKRMSNIYLKVTIEKNSRSQNFDFLSLKICQIFCQIVKIVKLLVTT